MLPSLFCLERHSQYNSGTGKLEQYKHHHLLCTVLSWNYEVYIYHFTFPTPVDHFHFQPFPRLKWWVLLRCCYSTFLELHVNPGVDKNPSYELIILPKMSYLSSFFVCVCVGVWFTLTNMFPRPSLLDVQKIDWNSTSLSIKGEGSKIPVPFSVKKNL